MSLKYLFFIISIISLKLVAGNDVLYFDEEEKFSTKNIWKRYSDFGSDDDEAMRSNSQSEECSCLCQCNIPESTPRPEIIRFELPEWRLKPFIGQIQFGQPSNGQPSSGQPSSGQPSSGQPSSGQPSSGQPSNGQPSSGQPSSGQSTSGQPTSGQPSNGQPSSGQPQRDQFQEGGTLFGPEFNFPQIGMSLGIGQPQEIPPSEKTPEGSIPQGSQPPSDQSPSAEIPGSKGGRTQGTTSVNGKNQKSPPPNFQLQGGLPQTDISANAQYGLPQGDTSASFEGNIPQYGFFLGGQRPNGYDVIRLPGGGSFQTTPLQWGSNSRDGKPQGGILVSSDASLPQIDMSIGNKGGKNQGGLQNGFSLDGMLSNLQGGLSLGGQDSKSQTGGSINGQGGLQGSESLGGGSTANGEYGYGNKEGQGSNASQNQDGQSSAGGSQSQKNSFGGDVDGGQLLDLNVLSPQVANNLKLG